MSSRADVLKTFDEKKQMMDDRISSGIEENRKGFAFLDFVDEQGNAVKDVEVKITQKTHDFKYGANLFMLDEFPTQEQNEQYRKVFAETFNHATLPFYWDALEPEQGKPRYTKDSPRIYRRPVPDLCLEYCESNGITPKAHCLNYALTTPQWAKGSVAWEKHCLTERFRSLAQRYAGRIPMWEVTNESYWLTELTGFYYQPDMVEWCFKLAENCFPANELIINDGHITAWGPEQFLYNRSRYYMQIERAMLKGARIDGIGMQFHMFYRREDELKQTAPYYDPEHLCRVMDTYAALNVPLQITEITIPCYSNSPEDEELQAQIIKYLYSLWFSHRAMESIVYWNLVDGFAAGCEQGNMRDGENYYYGGLLRYDMTPKPAFKVINDLFNKEWRTDLQLHSDSGKLSFKGFYGEYALEITAGGKRVDKVIHLSKEKLNNHTITL